MNPRKGRFHDKLVRQLTLTYLDHGDTAENNRHICDVMQICRNTIRNWRDERARGLTEDGRLFRLVEPWAVNKDHFEFLLHYLASHRRVQTLPRR